MKINFSGALMACLALALLLTASCKNSDNSIVSPKGQPPTWGPSMHKEMIAVIEQLDSFHQAPIQNLSATNARLLLNIFDAEKELARQNGLPASVPTTDTADMEIPVNGTILHARVYRPRSGTQPYAAILYFHGGGWVIGSAATYDNSARALAEQTGAVVVSLNYRLAPENKFPTAHNDAFATYRWMLANAGSLNINPTRIAVAGEDAGANLACNVSIAARDSGITMPRCQLLISPIADPTMSSASYSQFASAEPLSKSLMIYYFTNYLRSTDAVDTRINLLQANLQDLPPTTIISAVIDPLDGDALALQNVMTGSGVSVTRSSYDGVTHDFFGLSRVVPEARTAQGVAVAALRTALQ
ncbi:MAG: alpha/beta hydrolase [Chitinophagaceae bacterium]